MASWFAEQTLKKITFYDPFYHSYFLFKFVFSVHFVRNISTRVGNAQVLRVLTITIFLLSRGIAKVAKS